MPNFTDEFNLEKPLGSEQYNVNVQNGNMDKIEAALLMIKAIAAAGGGSVDLIGDPTDAADDEGETLFALIKYIIANMGSGGGGGGLTPQNIEDIVTAIMLALDTGDSTAITNILTILGNADDTGGSSTVGSVYAKLNRLITELTGITPPIWYQAGSGSVTTYEFAITSLISTAGAEWAYKGMNADNVFGLVLARAFNLPEGMFIPFLTVADFLDDSTAVGLFMDNPFAVNFVNSCPSFLEDMSLSPSYMDGITGTSGGHTYLIDNFVELQNIIQSPLWIASFIRTQSYSFNILNNTLWRNNFFTLSQTVLASLFITPGWQEYGLTDTNTWSLIVGTATVSNQTLIDIFTDTQTKRQRIVTTNMLATGLVANIHACRKVYTSDIINDVITSSAWNVQATSANSMTAMLEVTGYAAAMLNNVNWRGIIVANNNGSVAYSQNSAAVTTAASHVLLLKQLAVHNGLSPVGTAIFTSNYAAASAIIKTPAHFTATNKSLAGVTAFNTPTFLPRIETNPPTGIVIITSVQVTRVDGTIPVSTNDIYVPHSMSNSFGARVLVSANTAMNATTTIPAGAIASNRDVRFTTIYRGPDLIVGENGTVCTYNYTEYIPTP